MYIAITKTQIHNFLKIPNSTISYIWKMFCVTIKWFYTYDNEYMAKKPEKKTINFLSVIS